MLGQLRKRSQKHRVEQKEEADKGQMDKDAIDIWITRWGETSNYRNTWRSVCMNLCKDLNDL